MKTTVEVPDDLYRRVKSEAALRGLKVRDLVEEGLRLALEAPSKPDPRPSLGRERKRLAGKAPALAPVKRTIDAETERAARAFMSRLEGRRPALKALLFGSRARGTHRSDSDADLAVILKGAAGPRYKVAGEMAGIAFDVMQETGVLVDPLPLWEDELNRLELFSNPALIEQIKREGVQL